MYTVCRGCTRRWEDQIGTIGTTAITVFGQNSKDKAKDTAKSCTSLANSTSIVPIVSSGINGMRELNDRHH